MPTIHRINSIKIDVYSRDHLPPHFHAIYGGDEAEIDIRTGAIINGELPRTAQNLVKRWAELHRDELMANWEAARLSAPLSRSEGWGE